MLGIIIGVGAVIASMAIGEGAQAAVLKQIESLGSNLIVVTPGNLVTGGVSLGSGSRTTLNSMMPPPSREHRRRHGRADFANQRPGDLLGAELVHQCRRNNAALVGCRQPGPSPRGGFFNDDEVKEDRKVAVLGSTVAANLFPADPHWVRRSTSRMCRFKWSESCSPRDSPPVAGIRMTLWWSPSPPTRPGSRAKLG